MTKEIKVFSISKNNCQQLTDLPWNHCLRLASWQT
jgi:hypothetical protein